MSRLIAVSFLLAVLCQPAGAKFFPINLVVEFEVRIHHQNRRVTVWYDPNDLYSTHSDFRQFKRIPLPHHVLTFLVEEMLNKENIMQKWPETTTQSGPKGCDGRLELKVTVDGAEKRWLLCPEETGGINDRRAMGWFQFVNDVVKRRAKSGQSGR